MVRKIIDADRLLEKGLEYYGGFSQELCQEFRELVESQPPYQPTRQELEKWARELNLTIKEKPKRVSLLPCLCGGRAQEWVSQGSKNGKYYYKCSKCGFRSPIKKDKTQARLSWNECMRGEKDDLYHKDTSRS